MHGGRCWRCQYRLPINQGIPQHALIAAIRVSIERIEIERDNVPLSYRHVEYRRSTDQILLAPDLSADQEGSRVLRIAPLQHHAPRIDGAIETARAVRHSQPAPRHRI